jgi:prepilin-type N-terminal cleavage/methylation domain-containing protein
MRTVSEMGERLRGGGEGGFTLIEVSIASAVALLLIGVVFLTVSATLASQESSLEEGSTTAPPLLAVNAVEQLVNNAFIPNGTTPITSNCYSGSQQPLTSADGPFLPSSLPTATTLWICAIRPGTTIASTYEVSFTSCGGTSCLAIDQWTGCASSCTLTRVDAFSGVSDSPPAGSPQLGTQPFTYYDGPTQLPSISSSNVNDITAIRLDFSAPTSHNKAEPTEVVRTVVLPATLGGYG